MSIGCPASSLARVLLGGDARGRRDRRAHRCGIEQSAEDRHATTAKLGAFKTSMLQDVQAGRPAQEQPFTNTRSWPNATTTKARSRHRYPQAKLATTTALAD